MLLLLLTTTINRNNKTNANQTTTMLNKYYFGGDIRGSFQTEGHYTRAYSSSWMMQSVSYDALFVIQIELCIYRKCATRVYNLFSWLFLQKCISFNSTFVAKSQSKITFLSRNSFVLLLYVIFGISNKICCIVNLV